MDIGSIGAQYLEQNRYGVENLPLVRGSFRDSDPAAPSFEDHLRAAKEIRNAAAPAPQGLEAPKPGKISIDKTDKLYEQCEALESFLVKNLLTGMRKTVQKTGLIDEGFAGQIYEDMLWDEYAKDFTRNAGFGLAEQAYLELTGQRGRPVVKPGPAS